MARKASPRKTVVTLPQKRFVIINTDCHNVENIASSLSSAADTVSENIGNNGNGWDADDIYILEVVAIHRVVTTHVETEVTSIDQLDFDL